MSSRAPLSFDRVKVASEAPFTAQYPNHSNQIIPREGTRANADKHARIAGNHPLNQLHRAAPLGAAEWVLLDAENLFALHEHAVVTWAVKVPLFLIRAVVLALAFIERDAVPLARLVLDLADVAHPSRSPLGERHATVQRDVDRRGAVRGREARSSRLWDARRHVWWTPVAVPPVSTATGRWKQLPLLSRLARAQAGRFSRG